MSEACKATLASFIVCRYRLAARIDRADGPMRAGLFRLLREVDADIRRVERRMMVGGDEPHPALHW